MDGICKMFEAHLKAMHPREPAINYDIADLYEYLDSFADISALVYQNSSGHYIPHNAEWIKNRVYATLKSALSS
eukprot:m.173813 g.173813  ORF g.173813 m.173813 type:complete len:74 (-) comp25259_c0_seq1:126-347(-)